MVLVSHHAGAIRQDTPTATIAILFRGDRNKESASELGGCGCRDLAGRHHRDDRRRWADDVRPGGPARPGELLGPVASDPTLWRTLAGIDAHARDRLAAARAKTRRHVWAQIVAP